MSRASNSANNQELVEFAVICLVNAGKWEDAEAFVRRHPGSEASPRIAEGLGTALIKQEKQDEAAALLTGAYRADPSQTRLKEIALQIRLAQAIQHINAKNLAEAGTALGRALELDPGNREVARLQSSLTGVMPVAQMMAGQRAEAAAHWEKEFVETRSAQVAHHLAILYYWWAVQENRNFSREAAALWRKSIACWVYTLYDRAYWAAWREQKRDAYEVEDAVFATLPNLVRKTFTEAIEEIRLQGSDAAAQFAEDLRMDCWAEFEVAALMAEAGNTAPCGPILMGLFGWPRDVKTPPSARGEKGLRLGNAELPFLPDVEILLEFCKAGYTRPLSYLADNNLDRADQYLQKSQSDTNTMADGMRAYIAIQRAEQRYILLKCPPKDSSLTAVQNYAQQIRALLEALAGAQRYAATTGSKAALMQVLELFCRRISSEFDNFDSEVQTDQVRITEVGIDLMERALKIIQSLNMVYVDGNTGLAVMLNRLALQQEKSDHDRRIQLFERAVQFAPQNDLYKRNLAFSFYNRAVDKIQVDREGSRRDIVRAYQLAPDDDDIRDAYNLVQGRR